MRSKRACKSCEFFEDHREDFKARYIAGNGLCQFRLPPMFVGGDWHRNRVVSYTDWCSLWSGRKEQFIDEGFPQIESARARIAQGG